MTAPERSCSFKEMLNVVFGFIKEHYIESEGVHALEQAGRKYRVAAIIEVKAPNAKPSPVKSEKIRHRRW